jgi:hypothetical protein
VLFWTCSYPVPADENTLPGTGTDLGDMVLFHTQGLLNTLNTHFTYLGHLCRPCIEYNDSCDSRVLTVWKPELIMCDGLYEALKAVHCIYVTENLSSKFNIAKETNCKCYLQFSASMLWQHGCLSDSLHCNASLHSSPNYAFALIFQSPIVCLITILV